MKQIIPKGSPLATCDPSVCISNKINKCSRLISQIYRKHLVEFDLTESQLSTLFIVSKRGPMTQQQLTKILASEKSTVSRNMRRLKDRGYIKTDNSALLISSGGIIFLEKVLPKWNLAMKETRKAIGLEGESALNTLLNNLITL